MDYKPFNNGHAMHRSFLSQSYTSSSLSLSSRAFLCKRSFPMIWSPPFPNLQQISFHNIPLILLFFFLPFKTKAWGELAWVFSSPSSSFPPWTWLCSPSTCPWGQGCTLQRITSGKYCKRSMVRWWSCPCLFLPVRRRAESSLTRNGECPAAQMLCITGSFLLASLLITPSQENPRSFSYDKLMHAVILQVMETIFC